MRAWSLAATAALVVLAGLPGEAGGGFGASVSPITLVYERTQAVEVTNKSDIPVVASLEVDGGGWVLEELEFPLGVGERHSVAVTAAGEDEALLRTTIRPAQPVAGMDTLSVVLESRLRHLTWFEANDVRPWTLGAIAIAALGLLGFLGIRTLRRARRS